MLPAALRSRRCQRGSGCIRHASVDLLQFRSLLAPAVGFEHGVEQSREDTAVRIGDHKSKVTVSWKLRGRSKAQRNGT